MFIVALICIAIGIYFRLRYIRSVDYKLRKAGYIESVYCEAWDSYLDQYSNDFNSALKELEDFLLGKE